MKLDKLRISSLECSRRNHRHRLKSLENRLNAAGEEFKTASALIGAIRPLVEAITRDFEAHDRRLVALESFKLCGNSQGDVPNIEKRLDALEASEVNLRGYAQCTPTMSVFKALTERVQVLESSVHGASEFNEDDAYKAWRSQPWPDDVVMGGHGLQLEEAFRAGFRAGRK